MYFQLVWGTSTGRAAGDVSFGAALLLLEARQSHLKYLKSPPSPPAAADHTWQTTQSRRSPIWFSLWFGRDVWSRRPAETWRERFSAWAENQRVHLHPCCGNPADLQKAHFSSRAAAPFLCPDMTQGRAVFPLDNFLTAKRNKEKQQQIKTRKVIIWSTDELTTR